MPYDKYQKLKLQYTYNGGYTWGDVKPPRYKPGDLIEENSPDCGGHNTIYRWYALPDDYICDGYNKYYKEVYQKTKDEGLTWTNVEPEQTRTGELIEENSMDCGYGVTWEEVQDEYICEKADTVETWTPIPGEFVCEGGNKYYKIKLQYCADGVCFDSKPLETKAGELYEVGSPDCDETTNNEQTETNDANI